MSVSPAIVTVALGCSIALAVHLASIVLVLHRFRRADRPPPAATDGVTLIRPACGLENNIEKTLASSFALEHPRLEVIFCVADPADPAIPLIRRLIAENPRAAARLLTGGDRISGNPKLNNLVKGWNAACHDWIAMTDSNVMLPPDYVATLLECWTPGTGLVSSPSAGAEPDGFWADLECAFLNTYQARWQLAADEIGLAFAQGKTLFWRRDILEDAGGIAALGAEMAEDVAATKLVRRAGLGVRLAPRPFPHPVGRRGPREVWERQLRWARIRRMGFRGLFAGEILTGPFLPLVGALWLVDRGALPAPVLAAAAIAWYGAEWILARAAGWPASAQGVAGWLLRDLMLPVLWVRAWTGARIDWRGKSMQRDALPVPVGTGSDRG